MSDGKSVPTGVKVIAVLYYISAAFGIIFGLAFIVSILVFSSIENQIPDAIANQVPFFTAVWVFVAMGILFICLGILGFFVGRGLWRAKPWARITAIILAGLGILMAVISMIRGNIISNILYLVLEFIIGGYLLFNKNVKKVFA